MKVKEQNLARIVKRMNAIAGRPEQAYAPDMKPQAGHLFLDGAYGGHKIMEMTAEGGYHNLLGCGYIPKRQLYELCCAWLTGYQAGKEES